MLRTIDQLLNDENLRICANNIVFPLLDHYGEQMGGIHLPTIVGAVAALTGEQALLAVHPHMRGAEPQFIRSEKVEDLFFRGVIYSPTIIDIVLSFGALPPGTPLKESFCDDIIIRNSRLSEDNVPDISVTEDYVPTEWSPNAMVTFRPRIEFVSRQMEIEGIDLVYALAIGLGDAIDMPSYYATEDARYELTRLALEIAYGCACMAPLREKIE